MSFRVDADAVDGFGKLVGRAADGGTEAVSYVGKYVKIDETLGGDAWDLVAGDHDRYVSEAKKALEKVKSVLESSADELARSATYYRETDQEAAARFDMRLPGVEGAVPRFRRQPARLQRR